MSLWRRLRGRNEAPERWGLLGEAVMPLGEAPEVEEISEADRRHREAEDERQHLDAEREERRRDSLRRSTREIEQTIKKQGWWVPPSGGRGWS